MATYETWIDLPLLGDVRPWVKETAGAWGSFLMGDGLTYNPLPAREPITGQVYDVGKVVVPQYYEAWVQSKPNNLTPIQLLDLLNFLNDFTESIEAKIAALKQDANVTTCEELAAVAPQPGAMCRDLERWRVRLNEYSLAAGAVPESEQYDRTKTLWSVAAPLFLGWYGGKTGTEIPLAAGGFPPGFDTAVRHPPDIGTPYSIANGLGIAQAWDKERKHRIVGELGKTIGGKKNDKGDSLSAGTIIAGGLFGVLVLWWLLGTPKALKKEAA